EDLDGFIQALQQVLDRHDILRSAVHWERLDHPVQLVWRHAPMPLQRLERDPRFASASAQLQARQDARLRRIDVRQAPLLRAFELQEDDGSWLLMLLIHHLVMDQQTILLMQQEVQACLQGQQHRLPPSLPFRNFVALSRREESRRGQEAFFKRLLDGVDEPTLPYGLSEVHGRQQQGRTATRRLETGLSQSLQQQAQALGINSASLFHLAFALVMGRLAQRDDPVFGTVVMGRMQAGQDAQQVLGPFINTLAVRWNVVTGSVREAAKGMHALLLELMRYEQTPLSTAQRCSGVVPPLPLFGGLLNCRRLDQVADAGEEAPSQGVQALTVDSISEYPLTVDVAEQGGALTLAVTVDEPHDPEDVCDLMAQALASLEQALREGGQGALSALPVLPSAQEQRLHDFGQPAQALSAELAQRFDEQGSLHGLIQAQARRSPQALALVDEQGQLSYAELDALTQRLAAHIAPHLAGAKEAKDGQPLVLLCLPR
ncbi:condensation domain-containing protein, partial [Pelomonas sp. APW6]